MLWHLTLNQCLKQPLAEYLFCWFDLTCTWGIEYDSDEHAKLNDQENKHQYSRKYMGITNKNSWICMNFISFWRNFVQNYGNDKWERITNCKRYISNNNQTRFLLCFHTFLLLYIPLSLLRVVWYTRLHFYYQMNYYYIQCWVKD